jgi:hypothetical protein
MSEALKVLRKTQQRMSEQLERYFEKEVTSDDVANVAYMGNAIARIEATAHEIKTAD